MEDMLERAKRLAAAVTGKPYVRNLVLGELDWPEDEGGAGVTAKLPQGPGPLEPGREEPIP